MIRPMAERTTQRWLVKEEPEHYPYAQLERDKKTTWAGVKNPLAQKHLRAIRTGDAIFYYHTGKEKAVVAIATAIGNAYPDPADASGKAYVVDIAPARKLARPVTLAEIKATPAFASFPLVRMARLSVMPVSAEEWARIETMSRSERRA
jgi:predicted RNA-binding protein with PUA-like domain